MSSPHRQLHILACRLRDVMASVIHVDQTYLVLCGIGDSITLIRDVWKSPAIDTILIL